MCLGVVAEQFGLCAGSDDDFEEEFAGSSMQVRSPSAHHAVHGAPVPYPSHVEAHSVLPASLGLRCRLPS